MIDFEGDGIPELFIGYNGPNYVSYSILEVDHVYFHAKFNNHQDNVALTNLTLSMNKLE